MGFAVSGYFWVVGIFRGVLIEFLSGWNFRGVLMEFRGGWNKEEDDVSYKLIIYIYIYIFFFFFSESKLYNY